MASKNNGKDFSVYSGALAKAVQLATTSVRVFDVTVYNSNTALLYLQIFDSATTPADGAVPQMSMPVPADESRSLLWGARGGLFTTGVYVCLSTTAATKTLVGTNWGLFDSNFTKDVVGFSTDATS